MESANIAKIVLEELAKQVSCLTPSDIQKIEKGSHELSLKLVKKKINKSAQSAHKELSEFQKEEVLLRLNSCASREEGYEVISDAFKKNKTELKQFAKHLDVFIRNQDKIADIRDRIIEATVGAVIRSNVIQGKNTTKP